MSAALTTDSLRTILGREVEEIHLTIAKSSVLGLDPETIAHTIGIERAEVEELMTTQDYKDIRLLVGAENLKDRTERDSGWDGIENAAVRKLQRRTELENDTDTLLRIAAVANRATRRTAPPKESGPLDPSQAGARVPITLTQRYTEKLNSNGQLIERSQTRHISVLDGSAVNPNFAEVKNLLQGVAAEGTTAPPSRLSGNPQDEDDGVSEAAKAAYRVMAPAEQTQTAIVNRASNSEADSPFTIDELMRAAGRLKR